MGIKPPAMDNEMLKKGIWALRWEAVYRLKQEKEEANHFLAPASKLDSDFEKYILEINIAGKALDIGTGMGEQAVFLAEKGFDVTATDVSATALNHAGKLAADKGVKIIFVEDDILATCLEEQFDLIIDRGCFAILPSVYGSNYFSAITKLLKPNGWLFLKADKKKSEHLVKMVDERYFKVHTLTVSSYSGAKKIIPAILLIAQKIV